MRARRSLRLILEFSVVALLLLSLATALARWSPRSEATVDYAVVLNVKSLVYHCPTCELVRHCGADCATVDLAEARRRGGRPCVTCGGNCLARR